MKRKRHPKDKHYLELAADRTAAALPDNTAFLIVCKPFNSPESPTQYVSNMKREDAIKELKALLFQWGEKEEWMTHIS